MEGPILEFYTVFSLSLSAAVKGTIPERYFSKQLII